MAPIHISRLCVSSASISSVRAAKVSSPSLKSIQSSKLLAWSRDKVGLEAVQCLQSDDSPGRVGESHPFIRNVFTLSTCSHIVGSQVLSFESEADMLNAWRDFVNEVDPDVVIGYNIANFDFPYLVDRANAIKAKNFHFLGRMMSELFRPHLVRGEGLPS